MPNLSASTIKSTPGADARSSGPAPISQAVGLRVDVAGIFRPALERGPEDFSDTLRKSIAGAHLQLMEQHGHQVGFYDVPSDLETLLAVETEVKRLKSLADDLLVFGIGGSSLGGQALTRTLADDDQSARVHFVDNVDPDSLVPLLNRLQPERTVAAVITKSGGTVETVAQLLIVRKWMRAALGQGAAKPRIVFITDPATGLLRDLAQTEGVRALDIPTNVGGRFSILTPVGLLPAAFAGVDIAQVCAGAAAMASECTAPFSSDAQSFTSNPAAVFAAAALMAQKNLGANNLVMMPYSDPLRLIAPWFVQLWAESLGKRHNRQGEEVRAGQTPIPAVGATDQHAQVQFFIEGPLDKLITMISVSEHRHSLLLPDELPERDEVNFLHGRDLGELLWAERRATRVALLDAGVPVVELKLPKVTATHVGELLMLLQASCALTGWTMGIDPFDQPGVEAGKRMALGLLGRIGYESEAERVTMREDHGLKK